MVRVVRTTNRAFIDMDNAAAARAFATIATPQLADAALRQRVSVRFAPFGIAPVVSGTRLAGRAIPVQHFGSVDIFLEVIEAAEPGDVLVIDNGGRKEEGCIGDLTVLEAQAAGLSGLVVWGTHRDSPQLKRIGFPVFSYGQWPGGPERLDQRSTDALQVAQFGSFQVTRNDFVFADDDGCIFAMAESLGQLLESAVAIGAVENGQADRVRGGERLTDQLRFREYLAQRKVQPSYTFREYLRGIGGAIEE